MKIQDHHIQMIDEILAQFDFERVHKVLTHLNWTWWIFGEYKVPTIPIMVEWARSYLFRAIEEDSKYTGSGGFMVRWDPVEEELELVFELASWSNYYDLEEKEVKTS